MNLDEYVSNRRTKRKWGVLAWLDQNPDIRSEVIAGIQQGHSYIEIAEWLVEHRGCPFDASTVQKWMNRLDDGES